MKHDRIAKVVALFVSLALALLLAIAYALRTGTVKP